MSLGGRIEKLEHRYSPRLSPVLGLRLGDVVRVQGSQMPVEEWRRRHPTGLLVALHFDDMETEEL